MNYDIDDSMFALPLRFVGYSREVSFQNEEFLKKQLKEIKEYVQRFPREEQSEHALKWIEQFAAGYLKTWDKGILKKAFSRYKCPDCPLCDDNVLRHCQIHNQWLDLIEHSVTDEIDSREYVLHTLRLLSDHKEHLMVKLSTLSLQ